MTGGPKREDLTKLRDLYSPDMDIDSFESQMSSSDVFKRKALRFAQQNDQELFDAIINPNKKKVVSGPQEDGLESSTEGSPSATGSSQEGDKAIKPWRGSFKPNENQVDRGSEALRDVNSAIQFGFIPPSVERLKQEKESDQLDRRLQLGIASPSQQREYNEEMKAASDNRRSKIEAGLRESYNSDFSVSSNPDGVSMEYNYSYNNIDGKEVFNRVVPLSIDKDQSADQLYTFLGPKLQEIIALETYGYNDRIDSDPAFKEQQRQLLDLIGKEITFTSDESPFVTAGGGAGAETVVERREYTREDYFEDINELREKKRSEFYSEWSQGIKSQILQAFPGLTEEELKSIDTSLYTEYGVDLDLDNDGMYNVKSWSEDAMTSLGIGLTNVSHSLSYIPTYLKAEFAKLVSGYDESVVKIAEKSKSNARRNKRMDSERLDARRTKFTKDLSEALESGDAELFGRQLLNTTAETAPIILETTAVTILSGGTAAPYLAAGLIGTQTGIGTYMDIADDPELSDAAKLGIAITSGAAEGAFAFVGGKITSKAMMNQIARDAVDGDAVAKNRLKDFVKGQLITNGLEPMMAEGSEEFMVEFTNSIAEDIAYGRDVDFDAALSRGKTAFIAGAGAGKAFNTAGSVSGRVMGAVNSRFTSADLSMQLGIDAEIESAINSIQGVKDPELITVLSNRVQRLQELKNESRGEQRAYFEAMMVRQPEAFNDLMDANTRVSVLTEAYAKADESSKELISKEIDAEMVRIEGAHAMMSDTSSELTIDERNQLADMRVSSIRDGASRMQSVAEARLRQLKDDGAGAHEVSKAQAEVKAISESVSALTELQEKSRLTDGYLSEVMAAHEAGIMTDKELQLAVDQSNYFNTLISDVTGADIESISRTVELPKPGSRLFSQPVSDILSVANKYNSQAGLPEVKINRVKSLDQSKSKSIADAYDSLLDDNLDNPEVYSSYNDLVVETNSQFEALQSEGYVVELYKGEGEPYANSQEMLEDLRVNKHIYVFSTKAGFGDNAITTDDLSRNPMLKDSGFKDSNGEPLMNNDVFRAVHDIFGHGKLGNSFGPIGEENAWVTHSQMYSPNARRAMTTETRGQNSWVNFGPHLRNSDGSLPSKGDDNYIPLSQRRFADQKLDLLPDDMVFDMTVDSVVKPTNPLSYIDEAGFISPTMREAIYRLTPKGIRGMLPRPTMDADPLSFKEKNANLKDRARREFRKFFYSGGGLDIKSSEIIRGRDRSRRAFENTIKSEVQVLNRLLKKAGYDDQASIDLIQGTIDGTIVDERLTGVSEADARAELRSKLISQFGEKDGSIIFYMRDRIDSMTDDVISILETVKGNEDLVRRMRENKGSYLNRSYKVFSDESHRDRLSKPRGKRSVKTQHLFDDAIDYVMEENPGMSFDDAQGIVEQYVQDVVGKGHRGMVMSGSRVYTSNTKGRKEIAEPFRKLLGEIKDPVLQYTQTVLKLNEMKTSLEMQQELANHLIEAGLGSESITEDMNTPLTDSKTDSFGMEPLNAINVDPDFREAYESLDPLKSMQDYDMAIRNFIRFQSNVKMYKTVLSPTTTFRNLMSGMFLSANAGHQPFSSHSLLAIKEAWGGRKTREELRVITRKLIESGVIGDGGRSGEMLATINDAGHDISNITGDAGPGTKLFNVAQKLYAFGDDFYKVNGFMLEKDRLIKEGGMTEEQAWDLASERIRGGYPTYSYLPKNMQALRRFPLTGTFVSFPYEVMRTTKNNLRYMVEDFQAGRKKMGMRRLAGLFVATTGPSIVSAISMSLHGIDDEEEAMLRRAKAPWERNSQLLVLSNEDGTVTTLDLSFLAPSATWLKPFTALARSRTGLKGDDTAFDRAWDGAKELLDPYTSVDLSFATFSRLVNNKDEFGNPIYNGTPFNEDSGKAMKDMLGEADKVSVWLGKKVGPGAFNNFAEFMRANSVREDLFGSRVTKYKEYTNQEALLALFGFRTSAMPIPNSVRYTMHDVDAAIDNQKRFMTKAVDGEDPDYNEIVDQIQDWVLLNEERSATAKVMFERGTSLMTKSGAPRAEKTLLSVFDKSDREYLEKGELIPIPLPYSREESSAKSTLNVRLSGLWLEQLNKFQAEMEEAPAMTTNNINKFIGLIRSDYPELFNSINNKYVRRRIANEVVQQYIDTGEFNWVEDEEAIRADIEKKTVDVFRDVLRDYAKPTKSR
ncbi:MAG: hypothetical protein HRT61_00440 [Ekhidna sp.]|nr:hypothetical protein [Ekhidna sp.]